MPNDDNDTYLDPYRRAVQTCGPTFDATLWRTRQTQEIRFNVLLQMVDLNGKTILDAGCGLGDLATHLFACAVPFNHYIGVEGLPELVEKARDRALDRAEFVLADFASQPECLAHGNPDVIFFSGSLNTFDEAQARSVIAAAYEAANEAVVFNFLSDRCDAAKAALDTGPASRFDTLAWIDWSLTLTPHIQFRQDYLRGHDATLALFK